MKKKEKKNKLDTLQMVVGIISTVQNGSLFQREKNKIKNIYITGAGKQ